MMAEVISVDAVINAQEGDLRVWWIRNPPGPPEYHLVSDPVSAKDTLNALAEVDLRDDRVWGNAGGLEVYEGGEWYEWYDEEGRSMGDLLEEA